MTAHRFANLTPEETHGLLQMKVKQLQQAVQTDYPIMFEPRTEYEDTRDHMRNIMHDIELLLQHCNELKGEISKP